jgi:quercetin dioxygenase-like cupin family protein
VNATATTTAPHPRLDAELLHDIAAGIAASGVWRQVVRHDDHERKPVLLLATDAYEVWVIGWTTGQRADLHDHGPRVAGALAVVEGALTERRPLEDDRTLGHDGQVHDLPVGLVHEVRNDEDAPATSIHVYSPPLRTMTRYDARSLTPTVTEILPVEDPAYTVPAATLLAHPSAG